MAGADHLRHIVDGAAEEQPGEFGRQAEQAAVLRALEQAMPPRAMVSTDIGCIDSVANSYLRFDEPRSFFAPMSFGNRGNALPTIIGARCAAWAIWLGPNALAWCSRAGALPRAPFVGGPSGPMGSALPPSWPSAASALVLLSQPVRHSLPSRHRRNRRLAELVHRWLADCDRTGPDDGWRRG